MGLFQKKPPPLWYVLRPAKSSSSEAQPLREGPYTRSTIAKMYGDGQLGGGALIWTNEKIFPNAAKPNSVRTVRIMEWRRLDQLPDPIVRQLAAEAQAQKAEQEPPKPDAVVSEEPSSAVPTPTQLHNYSHGGPPPPAVPAVAAPPSSHAQPAAYPAPSPYPTGAFAHAGHTPASPPPYATASAPPLSPPVGQTGPMHAQGPGPMQPSPYQQPSAYPQPGPYPQQGQFPPPGTQ